MKVILKKIFILTIFVKFNLFNSYCSDILQQEESNFRAVQRSNNFYFIVQKITPENNKFWYDFAYKQNSAIVKKRIEESQPEKMGYKANLVYNQDGTGAFLTTVLSNASTKFVCFASSALIKNNETPNIENIIMSFCLLTNDDIPWTTHMGISRNPLYKADSEDSHKNISINLHAFAASFILDNYPSKIYMITKPIPFMRNILVKSLFSKRIYIGDNTNKNKIIEQGSKDDSSDNDKRLAEIVNRHNSPIKITSDINGRVFSLSDQEGKEIISINASLQKNELDWFFDGLSNCFDYYFTVVIKDLA